MKLCRPLLWLPELPDLSVNFWYPKPLPGMLVFGRCRAPNAIHPLVRQARGQRKVQRVVKWPAISKRAYCDPNMYDMMDSTLEHQIEPNDAEIILGQLNSAQRHAVTVARGKFLVLAGPGSGKVDT